MTVSLRGSMHLGKSLDDQKAAYDRVLAWAKNDVMIHWDSYRASYRPGSSDMKLLTDDDLRQIDAQVHPGLPD
jgi:hypothetical protein